ncbi:MAG: ribosome biosis GTPase / thiamine phosphate phosphatase [Actinomycetota bacterium]|nr:ribosome biosis GTPase / thiamine phosphate phosphatase [Actinomycetota bacterium]
MSPARRRRELDEDDVRVRPSRGSRPRTKDRPQHEDATLGVVVAVDRGRYATRVEGREVTAMKARELGRRAVVVGDRVSIVGDVSGDTDSLARIVRVSPRASTLRRTAEDTDPVERVIVANAEQLVVVSALADPTPRPRLIDRCLVAAYDAGLTPLLCLTKPDLAGPEELLETYGALDVAHVVVPRGAPPEALLRRLRDRVSVLVGHSGVGKSTLVNALVPGAGRTTGGVNAVTGRGRHTSSSAIALELPGGGWVIDTPGLRSFGLAHVDLSRVIKAFPDLEEGTKDCPRGCTHDEQECALDAWVAAGHSDSVRLASLRRLLRSREQDEDTG